MMTDQQLEQRLRTFFREEVGYSEAAPVTLRDALPDVTSRAPGRFLGMRRGVVLALAMTLLAIAAIGAILTLSQPRPAPILPLPPSTINLWIVIQNERSTPLEYTFVGGDGGGGAVIGCVVGVSSNVMTSPWSVELDGETILSSADRAAVYGGLAPGADLVIRVLALPGGELQVSPIEAGTGLGTDQTPPASCAGYVEPPPGIEIPPELVGSWWADVPADAAIASGLYEIYFLQGAVEHHAEGGHGYAEYVQGAVIGLDDETITFGASPVCAAEGLYGWVLDDDQDTLTLTPISDDCAERLALLASGSLELQSPMATPSPAEAEPSGAASPSAEASGP